MPSLWESLFKAGVSTVGKSSGGNSWSKGGGGASAGSSSSPLYSFATSVYFSNAAFSSHLNMYLNVSTGLRFAEIFKDDDANPKSKQEDKPKQGTAQQQNADTAPKPLTKEQKEFLRAMNRFVEHPHEVNLNELTLISQTIANNLGTKPVDPQMLINAISLLMQIEENILNNAGNRFSNQEFAKECLNKIILDRKKLETKLPTAIEDSLKTIEQDTTSKIERVTKLINCLKITKDSRAPSEARSKLEKDILQALEIVIEQEIKNFSKLSQEEKQKARREISPAINFFEGATQTKLRNELLKVAPLIEPSKQTPPPSQSASVAVAEKEKQEKEKQEKEKQEKEKQEKEKQEKEAEQQLKKQKNDVAQQQTTPASEVVPSQPQNQPQTATQPQKGQATEDLKHTATTTPQPEAANPPVVVETTIVYQPKPSMERTYPLTEKQAEEIVNTLNKHSPGAQWKKDFMNDADRVVFKNEKNTGSEFAIEKNGTVTTKMQKPNQLVEMLTALKEKNGNRDFHIDVASNPPGNKEAEAAVISAWKEAINTVFKNPDGTPKFTEDQLNKMVTAPIRVPTPTPSPHTEELVSAQTPRGPGNIP